MDNVRVRFAPSPTGFLHIGGLRTALFNWLWARQNEGKFILRIEDTDRSRYQEGAVENIKDALEWYGLKYGEGPIYQSKNLDNYKKEAEWLVEQGKAYYCFHSVEEIERDRKIQPESKLFRRFSCEECKKLDDSEVKEKKKSGKYVIRIKIDESEHTSIVDTVYKNVGIQHKYIHDLILLKSDGYPTYHLASVVDDISMKITNVIRGEEWLTSTPLHKILYKYFGKESEIPTFTHLPMVLGPDKSKLSKRHGAVAALDYKEQGYLPEAVLNFIALLGWNPKTEQEIFSLNELIKEFDLSKINKSSAVFNIEKLNWLNGQYIKEMEVVDLVEACKPFIKTEVTDEELTKIVALSQDRIKRFTDINEAASFLLSDELKYDPQILVPKKDSQEKVVKTLKKSLDYINEIKVNDFTQDKLKGLFEQFIKENELNNRIVLWPIRVALTGLEKSPGVFEVMEILRKEKVVIRVENALEKLKK